MALRIWAKYCTVELIIQLNDLFLSIHYQSINPKRLGYACYARLQSHTWLSQTVAINKTCGLDKYYSIIFSTAHPAPYPQTTSPNHSQTPRHLQHHPHSHPSTSVS